MENIIKESLFRGYYIKDFCINTETKEEYVLFKYVKNENIKYVVPIERMIKKSFSIKKPKLNSICDRKILKERVYRHFKGNYYYIKDIATNPFTGETFVIYQALYGAGVTYLREYNMFCDSIDYKRPDNITKQKFRFEIYDKYNK